MAPKARSMAGCPHGFERCEIEFALAVAAQAFVQYQVEDFETQRLCAAQIGRVAGSCSSGSCESLGCCQDNVTCRCVRLREAFRAL